MCRGKTLDEMKIWGHIIVLDSYKTVNFNVTQDYKFKISMVYFGSQVWRFQSIVKWPIDFGFGKQKTWW